MQIIPINNPEIVAKINQTYRVQFLKDVALARILDEQTFSSLNSIAFFNQTEIVSHIQSDQTFLSELFAILSEENISLERRKDVILFLHELSTIARTLHVNSKTDFFRSLAQYGLFAIFEYTLGDPDIDVRIAVVSILSNILEGEATLVRSFCLAQSRQKQKPLSDILVEKFISETDSGLRSQLAENIRMLIDTMRLDATEGLVQRTNESEEFLTLFYETSLQSLVEPISQLDMNMLVSQKGKLT